MPERKRGPQDMPALGGKQRVGRPAREASCVVQSRLSLDFNVPFKRDELLRAAKPRVHPNVSFACLGAIGDLRSPTS